VTTSDTQQRARLTAASVTLVEALILLGFLAFYVYEMAAGAADDLVRAGTSAALILVFGVLLVVLAAGWRRAADWARTPTLLWNALLLPVAWSLHDSGWNPLAVGVGVLAVVAIGAALAAPPREPADGLS
jgi:cytochrome bd-type quinol oxidase subunit 2